MSSVDVVVVSFNSRAKLRSCVEPLAGAAGVTVIVVDNASHDDSLDTIARPAGGHHPADGERGLRRGLQHRLALGVVAVRPLPQPGCPHVRGRRPALSRSGRRSVAEAGLSGPS